MNRWIGAAAALVVLTACSDDGGDTAQSASGPSGETSSTSSAGETSTSSGITTTAASETASSDSHGDETSSTTGDGVVEFTPNLPEGMTLYTDTLFGDMQPDEMLSPSQPFGLGTTTDTLNTLASINGQDADAPYGPDVYRMRFPGDHAGNGETGTIVWGQPAQGYKRIYFAMTAYVDPDYSMHTNGEKFFYPLFRSPAHAGGMDTIPGGTIVGWITRNHAHGLGTPTDATYGAAAPTFTIDYDAQIASSPDGRFTPPDRGVYLRKGVYNHIECYMQVNTDDAYDGVLRFWVDGELLWEKTDVRYGSHPDLTFDGVRFTGTRGGGVSQALTPSDGQERRYSRLAFYGSTELP